MKKKATKKASGWGGERKGAGRPRGSGKGPSADARYSRVAVMFTAKEIKKLEKLSRKMKLPKATVVYELTAAQLKGVRA